MELELNRIDYYAVGAILPNCMKLMPATRYKEQQRVRIIFIFSLIQNIAFIVVKFIV